MAIPVSDQSPGHYKGRYYKGSKVVINILLVGFADPGSVNLTVDIYNIADAAKLVIDEVPLSSTLTSIFAPAGSPAKRQLVINRDKSRTFNNLFGYFAEFRADDTVLGTGEWNFARFIPADSSSSTTGDDTIMLSAGGGSQIVLTNPDAPVDYVLTPQQVTDAYNQLPVQHNLNTLYCEVHAWMADGRPITDVLVVPWTGDTTSKPPANWSEVQLRPTSDSADKATRIMITSPSPLL